MAPLLQTDVHRVFNVWAIMFPEKRTADQMGVLERSYFISLSKRMSRDEFFLCAEKAQVNSPWFPKISEILSYRDEAIAELSRKGNVKALPGPYDYQPTEKEMERSDELLKMAKKILAGEKGREEGLQEMEELIKQPL